jgi:hypothetical protein
MKPLSRPLFAPLLAMLAAVMLMTRFEHFGSALHLPDASMAVFFLGGLWLRRHLAFIGLVLLAVAIDEVSIHYLGISDFCVTAAYAFLPVAYAMLWYAGRACSARLQAALPSLAVTLVVAVLAFAASFAISNGSFYWLGGRYAHPHMAEYVARLWHWGPLFARTTLNYVVVGLAGYALTAWLQQRQTTRARA